MHKDDGMARNRVVVEDATTQSGITTDSTSIDVGTATAAALRSVAAAAAGAPPLLGTVPAFQADRLLTARHCRTFRTGG